MSTPDPVRSRRRRAWVLCLFGLTAAADPPGRDGPGWGQPLAPGSLPARVWPDGRGLPAGQGSVAEGEALYQQACRSCHGPRGRGASAQELAGGIGSLATRHPDRTVGSFWPYAPPLFDYLRKAMPLDSPGSLTVDQAYSLTGYLLYLNGLIAADQKVDAALLSALQMPNRAGFVDAPRE